MKNLKLIPLYFDRLYSRFGKQYWWPCKSGKNWEIITGAILTQNTAWGNVEKALENLETAGIDSAEKILLCPEEELQRYIAPAGFFRQKSIYLKIIAEFYLQKD
ncbi:MAG: endonuclease III domain-containing protein, partial [Lentisphaeria bacterium]|nr:endonuclease III domain-containing protein [Lentisphaeria bacterium]